MTTETTGEDGLSAVELQAVIGRARAVDNKNDPINGGTPVHSTHAVQLDQRQRRVPNSADTRESGRFPSQFPAQKSFQFRALVKHLADAIGHHAQVRGGRPKGALPKAR